MQLRQRGIELLYQDRHLDGGGDAYAVLFEDPDRIKLELAAYVAEAGEPSSL